MRGNAGLQRVVLSNLKASVCPACQRYSLWIGGKLVHPRTSAAPMPSEAMPPELRVDYMEARLVFADSPRASAALLRLAVQKLCIHLGEPGKNLNADIGSLVRKGLPTHIQQALDSVRVVGNNAVHPGELIADDSEGVARALFDIVNWAVEAMIARPEQIAETYAKLPPAAKDAVQKRDGKS
jgi:Domain of unknown function (DUF4145)